MADTKIPAVGVLQTVNHRKVGLSIEMALHIQNMAFASQIRCFFFVLLMIKEFE